MMLIALATTLMMTPSTTPRTAGAWPLDVLGEVLEESLCWKRFHARVGPSDMPQSGDVR